MTKLCKLTVLSFLCLCTTLVQAQVMVSGTVTDESTGEGLAGVNVVISGTSTGTITAIDGNYTLQVPDNNTTLLFSYVGYLTNQMTVGSASQLDVTLEADVLNLEEIVVTGLASSIKRSNLANAVGTVTGAELVGTTGQPTSLARITATSRPW